MIAHLADDLLSAHLDGALDAAEEQRARSHLAGCGECSRRLELLGATARAISGLPGEPLPAPLDLSFLAPPAATDPLVIPIARRWSPPAWAAPVLAAAAVLLVAVTVGPRLVPHGGASTASSGLSGNLDQRSAAASAAPGTSGAAPALGTNPNPQYATIEGPRAQRIVPRAGGAVVEMVGSQPALRAGQPLNLSMVVRAGSSTLQVRASRIIAVRAGVSQQVVSGSGESIAPGQSSTVAGTWDAGKLGSGAETPGDYQLYGDVILADGTDLQVTFTIHVT